MSDDSEKPQTDEKIEKNSNTSTTTDAANLSNDDKSKKSSKLILFGFIGVTCVLMLTLGVLATLLITGGGSKNEPTQIATKKEVKKEERKEEKKEEHKQEEAKEAKEEKKEEGEHEGKEGESEAGTEVPQFYQVRPSIVITLPSSGRTRYVSLDIDLMTHSKSSLKKIEAYAPLIKNNLIDLLSKQTFDEMITEEGKKNIRKQALTLLQALMTEQAGDPIIEQVLFTSFIVQ